MTYGLPGVDLTHTVLNRNLELALDELEDRDEEEYTDEELEELEDEELQNSQALSTIEDDDPNSLIDVSKLSPQELQLLKVRYKQAETLQPLIRSVTLLEGKKGRGKTLAGVAIAKMLKEMFDIQTVCIGTSLDLNKENFGKFTFLDEKEFVQDLEKITQVSKTTQDEVIGNAIDSLLKSKGISVTNSCLIFDEAYKMFDARTPSDKLVRVFGYFIAMSRHYKSTILILCPFRDMIDKRVRRQIDYFGRCFTNKRTGMTTVRIVGGMESWKFRIYGPNYWDMYDTHAMVGFRAKHLEIGSY